MSSENRDSLNPLSDSVRPVTARTHTEKERYCERDERSERARPLPWSRHTAVLASVVRDPLDKIRAAIEGSRKILEMRDDWDDAGAIHYKKETWDRATQFLYKHAAIFWTTSGIELDIPKIWPGPDGSIDLYWDCPGYELVINVPSAMDEPAGFYGDNKENIKIKGTLNTSADNKGLLLWLMTQRAK